MLRSFWKLFPVFLVGFIARRKCERINMGRGAVVVRPFKGVYFEVPKAETLE